MADGESDSNLSEDELVAAKQAAEEAVDQAKVMTQDAIDKIKILDPPQLGYLAAMAVVVVFTLVFKMAAFDVASDYAVSETQAQAERNAEAWMNSNSYSAFSAGFTGKLMWLSALAGLGLLLWSTITKFRAGWVPLAQLGCATFATLMMLLLFLIGFPDLGAANERFSANFNSSATLLGFWIPLLAAGTATFLSGKRIFG
jgi:hypothetical protein